MEIKDGVLYVNDEESEWVKEKITDPDFLLLLENLSSMPPITV